MIHDQCPLPVYFSQVRQTIQMCCGFIALYQGPASMECIFPSFFLAHVINMDVSHVKSNRHFCNKIWQAHKYSMSKIGQDYQPQRHLVSTRAIILFRQIFPVKNDYFF